MCSHFVLTKNTKNKTCCTYEEINHTSKINLQPSFQQESLSMIYYNEWLNLNSFYKIVSLTKQVDYFVKANDYLQITVCKIFAYHYKKER